MFLYELFLDYWFATGPSDGLTDEDRLIFGYHAWFKKEYRLRVRATRKMGLSGEYWQCDRCKFWDYKKKNIGKHQRKAKH